jgi:1-acyl-sn-glycerol-3-phosphate acyltransferase
MVATTLVMYGLLDAETHLKSDEERFEVLFRWIERYGRSLLRIFNLQVRVRGKHCEDGELYPAKTASGLGRIFVMNHRSGMDIPITLTLVEGNIISRADLADWPVIGMAARRVGTLFVDRSSRASGAKVFGSMVDHLEAGRGVVVYPEGTAFRGDEVRPLRGGAFRAAVTTGTEIVPIGIAYQDHEMSYGEESFVAHMKRVASAPAVHVAVEVGEPIVDTLDRDPHALANEVRETMQGLVARARQRLQ